MVLDEHIFLLKTFVPAMTIMTCTWVVVWQTNRVHFTIETTI